MQEVCGAPAVLATPSSPGAKLGNCGGRIVRNEGGSTSYGSAAGQKMEANHEYDSKALLDA